jgi:hypothetical protein
MARNAKSKKKRAPKTVLTVLWNYTTGGDTDPAVANGVVYSGNDEPDFFALDASTGAPLSHYFDGGRLRQRWLMACCTSQAER